jgi:glycosyltransferase involved in cell wall biosynthesis
VKRAIVSVVNDLVSDQRVDKTCSILQELDYEVVLVGRKKKASPSLPERSYTMKRMKLFFEKGPFFYAEFNIRLFFFLLSNKADVLVSNDLDTLLPNFLVQKIRKSYLVYDSHELFTETPEVIHRPFVRSVWLRIERSIVPKLKGMITVSDSIATIFHEKYSIPVQVVRNIPPASRFVKSQTRKTLDLPDHSRILILQGSGINIQRGGEELIESMQYLEDCLLLVIGGGDVIETLKEIHNSLGLEEKVRFLPRMAVEDLYQYTMNADLGLTLDKDTNPNYRYSLPNKLFDYIHAGIPVLASSLVEIKRIIDKYQIGMTLNSHEPIDIANSIKDALSDENRMEKWKENLKFAASDLNWEVEKQKLIAVFKSYAG